ncbi:MAG: hypothetical protein R2710_06065 [Acidimicrobiales bacterium]
MTTPFDRPSSGISLTVRRNGSAPPSRSMDSPTRTWGLRLKGNSSLRDITADAAPEELPWLIRLDEYVEGQQHEGYTELVAAQQHRDCLNEAVALELLAEAASQSAVATSLSVNDSEPTLRLVIEHPDDTWMSEQFADDGALYKAESTGDYSYCGHRLGGL